MKFDIAATTILLTFCVAVVVITDRVEGMIDFGSTISNIRTFKKIRESTGVKLIVNNTYCSDNTTMLFKE